jgi:hypothetical protein
LGVAFTGCARRALFYCGDNYKVIRAEPPYRIARIFHQLPGQPALTCHAEAHDYLEAAVTWLRQHDRIAHLTNAYQDVGEDCALAVIELSERDTAMLLRLSV